MALSLNGPIIKSLATVNTTVTGSTSAFTIPVADSYTFYLSVTTAQTTCATIFLTSVDGGTTYVPVPWKFAGVTTTTGTFVLNVRSGIGPGNDVSLVTSNGALLDATGAGTTALAIQAVVDPRFMKLAYSLSGTSAWTLYCAAWPRGSTVGSE